MAADAAGLRGIVGKERLYHLPVCDLKMPIHHSNRGGLKEP